MRGGADEEEGLGNTSDQIRGSVRTLTAEEKRLGGRVLQIRRLGPLIGRREPGDRLCHWHRVRRLAS